MRFSFERFKQMKKSHKQDARRRGERGAALVTTLLMSALLLSAGGALILTTTMSATTAADSTAEMQAYYAAEAGLEAGLAVLRRNVPSNPAGTTADFRRVVCGAAANCTNAGTNLSTWLPYTNGVVQVSSYDASTATPATSYALSVRDASLAANTALPAAPYAPDQLLLTSTGFGPKGSTKRMQLLVRRTFFDFTARSTLLMRGAEDCSNMGTFDIGQSNAKEYNGNDAAGAAAPLPVFGTTCAGNTVQATTTVLSSKPNTVTSSPQGTVAQVPNSDLAPWLQDANAARALLLDLAGQAQSTNRYYTGTPGDLGSSGSPKFTFVDGDCSLGDGAGLLVVTGTLTMSGNASFDGVILVLGDGVLNRNGGGNGDILGALVVASFARAWPATENNQPHPFLAPTFNTNGGGNSTVQYDSVNVNNAMNTLGNRVLGFVEQ
jgi:hypothetical protein